MSRSGSATNSKWEYVPLNEVCDFFNGLWKGKKPPYVTASVIRNTNFTADGRIDLTDVAVLDVEVRHLEKKSLRKNDIIIEKSGGGPKQPVGRVVLFDLDEPGYSCSNFTSAIRVKEGAALDPVFLHRVLYWWYLSGRTESLQRRSTGIRNLQFSRYKELEVPLPPLHEQKRIVAKLDQAFAALDRAKINVEASLADTEELFDATLGSIFGEREIWHCEPLATRVKFIDYRGRTPPKSDSGIPLITAKNVRMGYVKREPKEFITEDTYRSWTTRGALEVGDVLFTTEAPLANVAQLELEGKVAIAQRLIAMQTNHGQIDPKFLKWSLISPQMQADIRQQGTGATVVGIKARLLKKIPFYVPSNVELQRRIGERCQHIFEQKTKICSRFEQKMTDLALLRQSILQRAFSGQLTRR